MGCEQRRNIGKDVVRDTAAVESGSMPKIDSQPVPEETKQQRGNKDHPQADDATQEIAAPLPLVAFDGTEDRATDEVPAQHKKEDDRLMTGSGEQIGRHHQAAMYNEVGKVHEEEIAPVSEQNKKRCQAAQEIKVDRSP